MSGESTSPSGPVLARRVEAILPGVLRWSVYSPSHKVELTSHAVSFGNSLGTGVVFDPIGLAPEVWDWFPPHGPPIALVLTNENHERDTLGWRDLFPVPVWAAPDAHLELGGVQRWENSPKPTCPIDGWEIIPLPGGARGETAWHCASLSLVVFGDALVNLEGRSFELLPDRYCTDPSRLRHSLRLLLERRFDSALFAHGHPLLGSASDKIAALL